VTIPAEVRAMYGTGHKPKKAGRHLKPEKAKKWILPQQSLPIPDLSPRTSVTYRTAREQR
jgi:hypothetical protein